MTPPSQYSTLVKLPAADDGTIGGLRGPNADAGEVSEPRDLTLQARAFVPGAPVARNGRTLGTVPARTPCVNRWSGWSGGYLSGTIVPSVPSHDAGRPATMMTWMTE